MSRKRRFLISEVEKIVMLLLLSQATNAKSNGINTKVLFIYLYFISDIYNVELFNILPLLNRFLQANDNRISAS